MTAAELAAFDEAVFAAMEGLERIPTGIANRLTRPWQEVTDRMVRASWHRHRRAGRVATMKVSTGIAWHRAGEIEGDPAPRYRVESEADAAGITFRYVPDRPGLEVVTLRIGTTLAEAEAQRRRR